MINSEYNSNANSGISLVSYHKQPSVANKKIALRDVQNDNRTLKRNNPEDSPALGKGAIFDATKVSETKRLTPDCPSSTTCHLSLSDNDLNNHPPRARRKVEPEIGDYTQPCFKNVCQKQHEIPKQNTSTRESNGYHVPLAPSNNMAPISLPYVGKTFNRLPVAESGSLKVKSDSILESMGTNTEQMNERFLNLQNFLKQCDGSNQRDYIQRLLHLSPTDLSRRAVELEKRTIQLTIEEGKEMQRMKAINVLGKSGSTSSPLAATQPHVPKK